MINNNQHLGKEYSSIIKTIAVIVPIIYLSKNYPVYLLEITMANTPSYPHTTTLKNRKLPYYSYSEVGILYNQQCLPIIFLFFFKISTSTYHTFHTLQIFIYKVYSMEQNKNYKRKTRQMPDATKQKISAALRGRKKSFSHCQAISKGLKEKYWASIR